MSSHIVRRALAGLVLTASCSIAFSRQPEKSPPNPAAITLSGSIDIGRLVDLAAEKLKVTIEYDAATIKGAVTVRSSGTLSPDELWQFMNRALVARGFVTIQQGPKQYSVVKVSDVQPGTPRTANELGDQAGPQPGYASILIRVQNRPTKEILEAVKSMLSKPSGTASEVGSQGLLIVSDLLPRLEQVEHVVALIDTPGSGVKIEEVKLESVSGVAAVEIATKLADKIGAMRGRKLLGEIIATADDSTVLLVAPESEMPTWRDLIPRVDRHDAMETRTYSTKVFSVTDVSKLIEQYLGVSANATGPNTTTNGSGFRMVVDELTGSLIVTGSASQQHRITELIERLDTTDMGSTPMRAFPVKNRPVHEIVATLSQLLQAGVADAAGVGCQCGKQFLGCVVEAGSGRQKPSVRFGPFHPFRIGVPESDAGDITFLVRAVDHPLVIAAV